MANQRKRSDDDAARAGSEVRPEGAGKFPEGAEKFEDQLENLEVIVTQIDSGELSLEQSIEAFERGVGLVRSLNHKLDEVERRVEVLMRGAGGDLRSTPYQGETGAADNGGTSKKADDEDVPF
ncbi:MAG: exodeoxyribonuclease VII small subunit [Candidatus Binataceae bacterium]|jgi:exodeoxyribonuclease VII small subunit